MAMYVFLDDKLSQGNMERPEQNFSSLLLAEIYFTFDSFCRTVLKRRHNKAQLEWCLSKKKKIRGYKSKKIGRGCRFVVVLDHRKIFAKDFAEIACFVIKSIWQFIVDT